MELEGYEEVERKRKSWKRQSGVEECCIASEEEGGGCERRRREEDGSEIVVPTKWSMQKRPNFFKRWFRDFCHPEMDYAKEA